MADVIDLEKRLMQASAKVAGEAARLDRAKSDRIAAESELLVRVVR